MNQRYVDVKTLALMAATIAAGMVQRVYERREQGINQPALDGYYEPDENVIKQSVDMAYAIAGRIDEIEKEEAAQHDS